MPFPFEVPFEELTAGLDTYVDAIFGALRSEFLTLPKGDGFVEYPVFEQGYEALKRTTATSAIFPRSRSSSSSIGFRLHLSCFAPCSGSHRPNGRM